MNNKTNIPMRTEHSKQGLKKMVMYIDSITPVKKMSMIEIGSYAGDSTEIFCQHFKYVTCIEPWENNIGGITASVDMEVIRERFFERMNPYKNWHVIRGFSYNACLQVKKESADIVYIDGAHDYVSVKCDIENFREKIKPGGWIAGHDYCKKFPGVVQAVIGLLGKPNFIFPDNSWIRRV